MPLESPVLMNSLILIFIRRRQWFGRRKSRLFNSEACLSRIEALNPILNAFITVTAESALAQARAAEAELQRGMWRGPLHGIPVALKDLIDTKGILIRRPEAPCSRIASHPQMQLSCSGCATVVP
jgi:aspartyl-tRNA(Asn)/glutamyl-tRNA(Gln) amidotransferase subunit A